MRQFKPITCPEEVDFFNIYEKDGIKYIHIFGYCWEGDDCWKCMECKGFILPLSEFIDELKRNDNFVDDTYAELPQSQYDFSEEQMTEFINYYFNGNCADAYLPFYEITINTPCGNYVR